MDRKQLLQNAISEALNRAIDGKGESFEQQWDSELFGLAIYALAVLQMRRTFQGEQTPLYGQPDLVGLFKNAQSEGAHEVNREAGVIYRTPHPDPAAQPDHAGHALCTGHNCRIASPHWHPVAAHPTIGGTE